MKPANTSKTLPVHTIQKKLSHIAKMRSQFASNRATILRHVEIKEIDYEMHFFEAGCLFLEQIFGYATVNYNLFSKDNKYMFWAWFSAEFKILENDFMNVIIGGELDLTRELWDELIISVPHEGMLGRSFAQFLKRMPNVEI